MAKNLLLWGATPSYHYLADQVNRYYFRENSYWVGLMNYGTADMNKAFADIAGTGATVVRTWYEGRFVI